MIGPPLGIAAWGLVTSALWTAFDRPMPSTCWAWSFCWAWSAVLGPGPRVMRSSTAPRWRVDGHPALAVMLLIGIRHLTTADGLLLKGDPSGPPFIWPWRAFWRRPPASRSTTLMSGLPSDTTSSRTGGCRGGPPQQCIGGLPREAGSLQPEDLVGQRVGYGSAASLAGLVGLLAFRHGLSRLRPSGRLALPAGWGLGFAFWPDLLRIPAGLWRLSLPPDRLHDWESSGPARCAISSCTRGPRFWPLPGVAAWCASPPVDAGVGRCGGAGLYAGLLPFSQVHPSRDMLCLGRCGSSVDAVEAGPSDGLIWRRSSSPRCWPCVGDDGDPARLGEPPARCLGPAAFWTLNLGVLFFVPPLVAWRPGGDLRRLWLASLLPFALCNVLVFTVPWNNIKILHSWFLVACILTAAGLGELWNTSRLLPRLLALGLALLSVATGLVSLAWHSGTHAIIPRPMLEYALQVDGPRTQAIATFPTPWSFIRFAGSTWPSRGSAFLTESILARESRPSDDVSQPAGRPESQARKRGCVCGTPGSRPGFPVNTPLTRAFPWRWTGDLRLYPVPLTRSKPARPRQRAGGRVQPSSGRHKEGPIRRAFLQPNPLGRAEAAKPGTLAGDPRRCSVRRPHRLLGLQELRRGTWGWEREPGRVLVPSSPLRN